MPPAQNPSSLLARHEQGLFTECRTAASQISTSSADQHRSVEFNNAILPRCQSLIEAIGHRMAYEAAVAAGVDTDLLALFEAGCILQDSSWYVQHAGLSRGEQYEHESKALNAVLPRLESLLEGTGAEEYVDAPILSQTAWDAFEASLEVFEPVEKDSGAIAQVQSML
jgi:hypothetical protein